MKKLPLRVLILSLCMILISGFLVIFNNIKTAKALELIPNTVETVKAEVLEVSKQEIKNIPGTDVSHDFQQIKVRILEGSQKGQEVVVENDYLKLKVGEIFYLRHEIESFDGQELYSVADPHRLPAIYGFIALFVFCVLVFGGWQGLRGLLALAASFAFIFYLLFPGIMGDHSPILVSIGVASLIIILGSYITHGFNKTTTSAVIGMVVTIIFTGGLAYFAVDVTRLSGLSSEDAVSLNFYTRGAIDFSGLLLGGILIGLLGVLYDAAIGQAILIEELHRAGPHLSRAFIFKRALRVGREHIGALVNTLAIAYVGASLPLLLLFYHASDSSFALNLNREVFATEVIRTMIGSIGLVLTVPITSLVAVLMLMREKTEDKNLIEKEEKILADMEHSHHSHTHKH